MRFILALLVTAYASFGICDSSNVPSCRRVLSDLNQEFLDLFDQKELAFWNAKMINNRENNDALSKAEKELEEWSADPKHLEQIYTSLLWSKESPSAWTKLGLQGWQRYFGANKIPDAGKSELIKLKEVEDKLSEKRNSYTLEAVRENGESIRGSSVLFSTMLSVEKSEADRKSVFMALKVLERKVLDWGFADVVKQRNKFAKALGYDNFYEYKLQNTEGLKVAELFDILNELKTRTDERAKQYAESLKSKIGNAALEAWNYKFLTKGSITEKTDPYFPIQNALSVWAQSAVDMGFNYRKALIRLDLVDRPNKYSNAFMNSNSPAIAIRSGSILLPSQINIAANANPGQIGSGLVVLKSLLHEGGHAVHFSNMRVPSFAQSQEYAPTSIALAETQSMFADSFLHNATWLKSYARDLSGKPMPDELINEMLLEDHDAKVFAVRTMMLVPYFEKWLYTEASENDLTPEKILAKAKQVEQELTFINDSPRPLLTFPHIVNNESSAYYHGYVLAELAVAQTQEAFENRYGNLVKNPRVGSDLTEAYWRHGNIKKFAEVVKDFTGKPLSADALINDINMSESDLKEKIKAGISLANNKKANLSRLNAKLMISHGTQRINMDSDTFDNVNAKWVNWINELIRQQGEK